MQRVDERGRRETAEQERRIVDVTVHDVEVVEPIRDGAELCDVGGKRIGGAVIVEAKTARVRGDEPRARARIARREERDVVAAAHELFREPGDDALGPSIQPRRDALEQRGNLSDAHSCEPIVQSRCRWHAHD